VRRRFDFLYEDLDPGLDALARTLVDACGEVRRELGAGLMESVYVQCLAQELRDRGVAVALEVPIPIAYKGRALEKRFRVDLLIEDRIIVEAKAVEDLHPMHVAQLLTYLRLSGKPLGFLVNFNAIPLGTGIHRFVNTKSG
jgi:GxxExxY protein